MKRQNRAKWKDWIVPAAMAAVILLVLAANRIYPISYHMYSSEGITYEKGTVTEILAESLEREEGSTRYRGTQVLKVRINSGELAGQEIEVSNELSATHNILAAKGQNLIIQVDAPEGLAPFYSVFNYDRTTGIVMILSMFALFMVLVGGRKGIRSMLGLAFALFLIIAFLLPAIYHGWSPVGMGVATALLIAFFSMALLNGFGEKTLAAFLAVLAGIIASAVLYYMFSAVLHLSGFNLEEAEELILIQYHTGMNVGQVLFAGILIASLGAVMDMTMSVASALFEMKRIHPELSGREIFRSGMEIGRDMIGTMCETLILAFAGTGITALLVMISYGTTISQLLSSDYVALELIHSFTGSLAVILSVPITAGITAFMAGRNGRTGGHDFQQEKTEQK